MPEPAPLAPIPSPDGWRPAEQLGLFPGLPGVIAKLLPPSTGGTASANDNNGGALETPERARRAPESLDGTLPRAPRRGGPRKKEVSATVRDPAPWGEAAPSTEWVVLKEDPDRVG